MLIGVALAGARRRAADRLPVRALHRHLLRHADAGLRHAGALVPVQVLPPDRRRQRHARAAHAHPRARVRRLQQDRAPGRARSTTTAWRCWCSPALIMWRIVHSPFGLHLRALRDNAQKAEYLGVRVRQFRLAAFVISAIYGAIGGAILGFRIGLADPELVLLDALGPSGVHDRARRLLQLPRADRRRAGADAAAGPAAVATRSTGASCSAPSWPPSSSSSRAAWPALRDGRLPRRRARCGMRKRGRRATRMTPLVETRGVSKHYGAFRALDDVSRRRRARASSSRSSAPTAPARPRWSICSPACWCRPRARCFFKGDNIAGVGPVALASAAWRAPSSSCRSSRS